MLQCGVVCYSVVCCGVVLWCGMLQCGVVGYAVVCYSVAVHCLGVISSKGRDHSSWTIRPVSKVIPNTVACVILLFAIQYL